MSTFRTAVFALALSAFAAAAHAAPGDRVTIEVTGNNVTARSITPGGSALFFAVGLGTTGYDPVVRRWCEVVSDDDRDGVVTLTSKEAVPFRSIWVAVDLRNAQFAVGGPAGYSIRTSVRPSSFRKGGSGYEDLMSTDSSFLEAVYVHPNGSAWKVSAMDGEASDADGKLDAVTTVSLSSFAPLAFSPLSSPERPKEFTPGGVLIAIDYYTMRVFAVRLDGAMLGGH